jgi:hypothetical protein
MKIINVEVGEPKKGPQQVAGALITVIFLISIYLGVKFFNTLLSIEDLTQLSAVLGKTLGIYSFLIASLIYLYNKGFIIDELVTAEE